AVARRAAGGFGGRLETAVAGGEPVVAGAAAAVSVAARRSHGERGPVHAGARPAPPRHCNGHDLNGSRPLGVFTREGEPIARSQETSPFAPPVDPSREGWWRCAPRRR